MNLDRATAFATVEADLVSWMAVHGQLLLALRHPQNIGASAQLVSDFCDKIGRMLVEGGPIGGTFRIVARENGTVTLQALYGRGGTPLLDAALKRLGENDEEIERLRAVAVAAKALAQTAHDSVNHDGHDVTAVSEPALTALESALEAAGYGMTDEEAAELEKRDE